MALVIDPRKSPPLSKARRLRYALPLLALAAPAFGVKAAPPSFSGDAVADFAALPGVQSIPDPTLGDVGVPDEAPPGTVSGWDVSPNGIYLNYDWGTDILYVGVDCTGICGDADGNGDPSGTSLWSQLNGGNDRSSYGGEEWMALIIDTNNDGSFQSQSTDVVVGIPRGTNFFGLHAAVFNGTTEAAGASFGSMLPNGVTAEAIPDTEAPDLEFAIHDFSTLPGFNFNPDASMTLHVHFAQGSDEDGGIGEEHVEGAVGFEAPSDYGDAPAPYPTFVNSTGSKSADDGPSHKLLSLLHADVYLGSCVDAEAAALVSDAVPSLMADADDNDPGSLVFGECTAVGDEDGVKFLTPLYAGETATVEVTANVDCFLSGWIDYNADGDWDDLNDTLFPSGVALEPGAQSFQIDVPEGAHVGATYARFRCTTDGPTSPTGAASDGEVEDYRLLIMDRAAPQDYGDAPSSVFPTLLAEGGACHALGSQVYLGNCVDSEADGLPSGSADGDDKNTGLETYGSCTTPGDDEDGVRFVYSTAGSGALTPGATESVEVRASAACTLSAWIDFDGDGNLSGEGETLFPGGEVLSAGLNTLTFLVPAGAPDAATYARFRCTTDGETQLGGCASDGEVEDHPVIIGSAQRPPCVGPDCEPENIPVLGIWGWLLLTLGIGGLYRAGARRRV